MIDPAAAKVLRVLSEGAQPMPEDEGEWLRGYRAEVDGFVRFQGTPPDIDVRDASFPGPAGPLPLRIYGADAPLGSPTVVYFHGGGFVAGSLGGYDIPLRHLALRSGWRVAAVDYRLAPEHPFPAALDDCMGALRHVAGQGYKTLAIAGDSAGGLLAAVVARKARDANISLALQILLYPNTDLREAPSYESRSAFDGTLIRIGELYRSLTLYVAGADRADPDLSPVLARNLNGLCRAFVVTNEADPLRDEGERYARSLADAGVQVERQRLPCMIHAGLQLAGKIPQGDALISRVARRLKGVALQSG